MRSITMIGERLSNKRCVPVDYEKNDNDCQNSVLKLLKKTPYKHYALPQSLNRAM